MKPYFTKYLPVEGKIKEGDIAITTNNNANCPAKIVRYLGNGFGYEALTGGPFLYENTGFRKVKLFLCSRDIQVGDKVYQISYSREGIVGKFKEGTTSQFWLKGEDYNSPVPRHTNLGWGKVISEISPDALSYVKEGDEFDPVDLAAMNIDTGAVTVINFFETFGWERKGKYIFIKGPCGHFH